MINAIKMLDTSAMISGLLSLLFIVSLGVFLIWQNRNLGIRAVTKAGAPALLLVFFFTGCVYFSGNLEPKEQAAVRNLFVQGLTPVAIAKEFEKNPPSIREWNSDLIEKWLHRKITQQQRDTLTSSWLEQHWAAGGTFLKNPVSNPR